MPVHRLIIGWGLGGLVILVGEYFTLSWDLRSDFRELYFDFYMTSCIETD